MVLYVRNGCINPRLPSYCPTPSSIKLEDPTRGFAPAKGVALYRLQFVLKFYIRAIVCSRALLLLDTLPPSSGNPPH
jgi:hypothetical protein